MTDTQTQPGQDLKIAMWLFVCIALVPLVAEALAAGISGQATARPRRRSATSIQRMQIQINQSLSIAEKAMTQDKPNIDEVFVAISRAQQLAALQEDDRGAGDRIKRVYGSIARVGSLDQRTTALTGLAALQVKDKQYASAIGTYRQLQDTVVEPEQKRVITHNLGRMLELNQQPSAAWTEYMVAISQRPKFSPAVAGCFRLGTPEQLSEIVQFMIEKREPNRALLPYEEALRSMSSGDVTEGHLNDLMRLLMAANTTVSEYRQSHRNIILAIGSRPREEPLASVRDIDDVFVAEWAGSLAADGGGLERTLGDPPHGIALSRLLKHVAEDYAWQEKPGEAVVRYYLAWRFNIRDTEAALGAAGVLLDHETKIDPNGVFLNNFVNELVSTKIDLTRRGELAAAVRLHLVLATIFERKALAVSEGSPSRLADRYWSRVGFHLDLAREKLGQIDRRDPLMEAEVWRRSGRMYVATGDSARAAGAYMRAMQYFSNGGAWLDVIAMDRGLGPLSDDLGEFQQTKRSELRESAQRALKR